MRESKDGFSAGLGLGLAVGFAFFVLGSAGAYFFFKTQAQHARRGFNPVPIVVAVEDLGAGTPVTLDRISQRSLPEQFVTPSLVQPDKVSRVMNLKLRVPLQAGDPLRWSDVAAEAETKVLFAAREVPLGAVLTADDVRDAAVGDALLTASWVRAEEQAGLIGRITIAPFHKGDPILWTHVPPKAIK